MKPAPARPLLEVEDLHCSYGPLQVLFGVSLEVLHRGRVALLGTNGAGKSTLLRAVSGLVPAARGSIRFDGDDITRLSPEQRVALGIVQVAGGRATFPTLTVEENLRVGAYPFLADGARVGQRIEEVLELFPALRARLRQPAGTLSGGEQQMMALGRALVAGPRLLLVDELSLGLAPVVMQRLIATVASLHDRGVTLLLVEQSLNVAATITDHAYFLEKGEVRFSGPTAELLDRGELARSVFLGSRPPGAGDVGFGSPRATRPGDVVDCGTRSRVKGTTA